MKNRILKYTATILLSFILVLSANATESITLLAKDMNPTGGYPVGQEFWVLSRTGEISALNLQLPYDGEYTLNLSALGFFAPGGWPELEIVIDGQPVTEFEIQQRQFNEYVTTFELDEGSHDIVIRDISSIQRSLIALHTVTIEFPASSQEQCMLFGAAIERDAVLNNAPGYIGILRDWEKLNTIVFENEHKFNYLRHGPSVNEYDFSIADQMFQKMFDLGYKNFAFHAFFWHQSYQLDNWVYNLNSNGIKNLIVEHLTAVFNHYDNQLFEKKNGQASLADIVRWDVVNEAISDGSGFPLRTANETPFAKAGTLARGYLDWLEFAYSNARTIGGPNKKLVLNDYNVLGGTIRENFTPNATFSNFGSKAEAFYYIAKHLKELGILDGIGGQSHEILYSTWGINQIRENLLKFKALGLDIYITEYDLSINTNGAQPTAQQLEDQAQRYRQMVALCTEVGCKEFTMWGIDDGRSWLANGAQHCTGCTAPLPHDANYNPKPAKISIDAELASTNAVCER